MIPICGFALLGLLSCTSRWPWRVLFGNDQVRCFLLHPAVRLLTLAGNHVVCARRERLLQAPRCSSNQAATSGSGDETLSDCSLSHTPAKLCALHDSVVSPLSMLASLSLNFPLATH
jgi:hypothetical protein